MRQSTYGQWKKSKKKSYPFVRRYRKSRSIAGTYFFNSFAAFLGASADLAVPILVLSVLYVCIINFLSGIVFVILSIILLVTFCGIFKFASFVYSYGIVRRWVKAHLVTFSVIYIYLARASNSGDRSSLYWIILILINIIAYICYSWNRSLSLFAKIGKGVLMIALGIIIADSIIVCVNYNLDGSQGQFLEVQVADKSSRAVQSRGSSSAAYYISVDCMTQSLYKTRFIVGTGLYQKVEKGQWITMEYHSEGLLGIPWGKLLSKRRY